MSYVTPSSLLARFGPEEIAQVSDDALPRLLTAELLAAAAAGEDLSAWPPAAVAACSKAMATIQQAIEDAESAVDGYLSGRYGTPMASAPAVIKRLASDIARYFLYDDQATESVQKRYDAAIAFLRDVAAGKVSLGAEVPAPAQAAGGVQVVSAPSIFGRRQRGL